MCVEDVGPKKHWYQRLPVGSSMRQALKSILCTSELYPCLFYLIKYKSKK